MAFATARRAGIAARSSLGTAARCLGGVHFSRSKAENAYEEEAGSHFAPVFFEESVHEGYSFVERYTELLAAPFKSVTGFFVFL